MNCDRFEQRMNALLDQRHEVDSDPLLQSHAQHCESCRDKLAIWQPVSQLLAPEPVRASSPSGRRMLVATAAGLIFALFAARGFQSPEQPIARAEFRSDPTTASQSETVPADETPGSPSPSVESTGESEEPSIDPQHWWRQVQPSDWVAQSMPTVRSVREGVAPIGRSFLQAVNLLTFGRST